MALQEELKRQGDFLFKYRSYLPLVLLVWGIIFLLTKEPVTNMEDVPLYSQVLKTTAIYVGLLGLFIRMYTIGFAKKNTSGRNTTEGQVADSLNLLGLYSIIRNPLYVGNYLMWLSIVMFTGSLWFVITFSLVFWIYYERIVYAEEQFLREKFGKDYLEWTEKTAPFLPKHLKFKKPDTKFD